MGMKKCPICKKEYYEKDIICPTCFSGFSQGEKEEFSKMLSIPEVNKVMSMTPSEVMQLLDDEDDKKAATKEMKEEPKEFYDKTSPEFRKVMSLIREIPSKREEAAIFDDYFHGSRLGQPERVRKALIRLDYYFPNESVVKEELKKLNLKLQRKG